MASFNPSQLNLTTLRPSEKVRLFFEEELQKGQQLAGGRLPTIKEVSQHLGISPSTVQAVFSQLAREGQLIMIPGKGTFISDCAKETIATDKQHIITVSVHEGELSGNQSTWGKEICSGILHELTAGGGRVIMKPFYIDKALENPELLRHEVEQSSGAIVFPSPIKEALLTAFRRRNLPVVNITPESMNSTSNFVGPDFFLSAREIARCWKSTGRRHIVFLMHTPFREGSTCTYSVAGFENELQAEPGDRHPIQFTKQLIALEGADLEHHLDSLFNSNTPPDAIYSPSDVYADISVRWLLKRGIAVPEEVSIIGGTGLYPIHDAPLPCTVIQQPLEEIGRQATRMLIAAIENENQAIPGKFISSSFRQGGTTTEAENRLLPLAH